MPFYDVARAETSNSTGGTESTHFWGHTAANQETTSIMGFYAAARMSVAGGGVFRLKDNTGTTASGGTSQTPAPKNRRSAPAAQSLWFNDNAAITPGTTLTQRMTAGFAQTGGQGGYVPVVMADAVQLMPNSTNPVDVEFTSIANGNSVLFDATIEILEGTA